MAITLRTNKGSALTYDEMDKNFSQYFYSASRAGNIMTLYYTGSSNLVGYDASRTITVDLNPSEGTTPNLVVAAPVRSIQYNRGSGQLGANAEFVFSTNGFLGVGTGTPAVKAHIKGNSTTPTILRLESINTTANVNRKAIVEFYHGARNFGTIGKDNYADNNLYIKTYADDRFGAIQGKLIFNIGNNLNAGAFTTAGFGIGTLSPNYALDVQGNGYFASNVGIGIAPTTPGQEILNVFQPTQLQSSVGQFVHIAKFGITPINNTTFLNVTAVRTSVGSDWTTEGLRIQSLVDNSYKSYIQFNGHDNIDGFSIGTGNTDVSQGGNYNDIAERFRVDGVGRVCIGTKVGTEILTVQGNISGSGFIKVNSSANIGTSLTTGTTATIGTDLTVVGTATIGNIPTGTAGAGTKILTANNDGQIQYITGTFPLGGIVMWAGSPSSPPAGWTLCDGSAPVNGVTIPDLRERFIVGAGGNNPGVVTKNYATATFQRQADTWYGTTGAVTTAVGADGEYNVVTTGTFYQGTTTSGTTVTGTVFAGPVGGVNGIPYFVYQKTTGNKHYFIYSVIEQNYILMQGEFTGAGTIANYGIASTSTYSAGKYFRLPPTTRIASADYNRDVNGTWVNGKRPDLVGLYYYDTLGYNVGDRGGFNEVELEVAQMPSHNHPVRMHYDSSAGGDAPTEFNTNGNDEGSTYITPYTTTDPTGQGLPHENRPPYYALAFIIYTGV